MTVRRLPPLHALRAFEAAARHSSITRAAEELNVTPGAVSRHVRALEKEMQTLLFQRRSTGLALTTAGEALATSLRDALDGMASAVSGVRLRRFRRLCPSSNALRQILARGTGGSGSSLVEI